MTHRVPRVLAIVACLLVAFVAPAARAAATANEADFLGARLQRVIDDERQALNVPGVSAAVVFADGSRWSGQSGKASLATKADVAATTPFVAGSITKTFIAALLLELAEDGRLSLEDPLSLWLPDYPNAANITLRQLLSHTSGIFDYFKHPDFGSAVYNHPDRAWTPLEILTRFQHAPYFAPGAGYRYSNTNYVLLGLVAEATGGASVADQLETRFWQPLGLNGTTIQSDGPPPGDSARGYLWSDGRFRDVGDQSGYRPTRSAATVAWSAGDVVSTADDVASWTHALYGGDVLADASLADMVDYARYPGAGRYGLGTITREYRDLRLFGHTGSLRGYVGAAWYVESHDATFVVLTNRGRTSAHQTIAQTLMDVALFDTTPPTVPTGLAGVAEPRRYVSLSWDASTDDSAGDVRYRVFRNGSPIGAWTTALTYRDRPARVGRHRYQVRAKDQAGNKSAKSAQVTVTVFR